MIKKNRSLKIIFQELMDLLVKAFGSLGLAIVILAGLVLVYVLFLAIFIKGTLSAWF
ncbi:MAG: hypothetical protein V1898_02715 [Patescibacteria group bacterium]